MLYICYEKDKVYSENDRNKVSLRDCDIRVKCFFTYLYAYLMLLPLTGCNAIAVDNIPLKRSIDTTSQSIKQNISSTEKSLPSIVSSVNKGTEGNVTGITSSGDDFSNSINVTAKFTIYFQKSGFHGELDPAYYSYINTFWLQFEPPTRAAHFGFAIVYLILMIVGYFGNLLVIFMFMRFRSLRTPANTLVINLAVSDFLMMLLGPMFIYNSIHEGPAVSIHVCRFYGFLGGLSGTASIATLAAIAIDRYNVVVYPLNPLRSTTRLRSRLMILFCWIYSAFFAIIPYLEIGLSKYVPEGYLTACTFEYLDVDPEAKKFMFIYFVFAWVIPLATIGYCYFYILRVVACAEKIQSSKDKSKTEAKLAMVVIGIIGLWFLAWTPYAIVALLGITSNEKYLTPLGSMLPAVFCKTSACVNPYLYAVNHPRFRSELRRLLGCPVEQRISEMRSSYVSSRRGNGAGNDANHVPLNDGINRARLQRIGVSLDSDMSDDKAEAHCMREYGADAKL